jgi:hypothetical protein
MADVAWAIANSNHHGATRHRARIDARIHVDSWLPEALVVPEVGQSESASAIAHLQEGKIYLYDRGYMSFDLLKAHYPKDEATSWFVARYKPEGVNSPVLADAEERPLTKQDRAAGVISDRRGYFQSSHARRAGITGIRVRELVIELNTFDKNGEKEVLRLVTNLLDVSAENVGKLYRYRWQVELFFRWLKTFAHFGHLISHGREGVLTHFYVAIIGMLLMYLHTGFRPSKYLFALVGQVAMGSATLEEILPILRERERRSELERQSRARRAAKKKA